MKMIQLLPTIAYGDAVGNDTLAIDKIIREMGYETRIYAENIDPRLPEGTAAPISQLPALTDKDVIVYHGSVGTELNDRLPEMPGKKVMIYHNITPPSFFRGYSANAQKLCIYGLAGMKRLASKLDYCIADSEFNKRDLLRMGYTCPIDVCPILIPLADYEKTPDSEVMERYGADRITNLLFVGRISPNKKQEDIIRAFYAYHKYYNERSRLILCGSWSGMDTYHDRLVDYTGRLGLTDDVIFTGHVKFDEILAWYRLADAFVCMSEHEGFCVPLVEAMCFEVPIVAFNSCAIPDTLGESGILLEDKSPAEAAASIDRVVSDAALRGEIITGQNRRLKDFSYEKVSNRFKLLMKRFVEGRV